MRAGKLKTRRYKMRRSGRGWILLILLGLVMMAGAYFFRSGERGILMDPAPTLTPQESAGAERTLTFPGQSWYALQLGVFDQKASASSLAASFQGRGAGGYVTDVSPYRVLAAAYESRASAQSVQNQLRTLHGVECYVHEITSGEIVVKVSGQTAQLTALSDAYDALSQSAGKFSALSQGLDRHELERNAIIDALKSEKNTMAVLSQRLQTLFGDHAHEAVGALQRIVQQLSQALDSAILAQDDLQLGARIKYCQLLCIDQIAQYAALLSP